MSQWSRFVNVFRRRRVTREIDAELASHLEEAAERGRDPEEARRAFGSSLRHREHSRDIRLLPWLEAIRADFAFSARQLRARPVTTAAAILSLALAIGACSSAFRLIDAVLLRSLPVATPDRLYALTFAGIGRDGLPDIRTGCSYPMFRLMRAAVAGEATLLAIKSAIRVELTYASEHEMERAYAQYVSGWTFEAFGLRPALGRLFTEDDDRTPGARPYAVISHDYWTRRFGRDPDVIGRTFRSAGSLYEIVGVVDEGFTGTGPGTLTDLFVPTMMMTNGAIDRSNYEWFRTWVRLQAGVPRDRVREKLNAVFRAFQAERVRERIGAPEDERVRLLAETLDMEPAGAGLSFLQTVWRPSLVVLGALVTLVLLITCANVANLMLAQTASRAREMALRVAIGAGRARLVQLVLVDAAWLALVAAGLGALLAWWSAPAVASLANTADDPTRLIMPLDWRVIGVGLALALLVLCLSGLAPALRASSVQPVDVLRGGPATERRHRLMHVLIGAQAAFCMFVLFLAGLFVTTFDRLSAQPVGFSPERLLYLETSATQPEPAIVWEQLAARVREAAGVDHVGMTEWLPMTRSSWSGYIARDGGLPSETASQFLSVSPGWREAMAIPLLDGRDVRASDGPFDVAVVNRAFARRYFGIDNPVGRWFEKVEVGGDRRRVRIVGLVGDARYLHLREPVEPTVHFPLTATYGHATFVIRTTSPNPAALVPTLRRAVSSTRADFRVVDSRTQTSLNEANAVRERLLAMLASCFAIVALVLAAVGLYGVLHYSVIQQRRETAIRITLGAQVGDVARRATLPALSMVLAGLLAGLALALVSARALEPLFYDVRATEPAMLMGPALILAGVAVLAALPAAVRAARVDPAVTLRAG
jgi:putative ABC transport system permease protein